MKKYNYEIEEKIHEDHDWFVYRGVCLSCNHVTNDYEMEVSARAAIAKHCRDHNHLINKNVEGK